MCRTENVLTAAIEAGVENVVCLSTDKAAYPVNAMGTSKAMMEKVSCKIAYVIDYKDLLYTLWKCNVQPWICNSALDRSD